MASTGASLGNLIGIILGKSWADNYAMRDRNKAANTTQATGENTQLTKQEGTLARIQDLQSMYGKETDEAKKAQYSNEADSLRKLLNDLGYRDAAGNLINADTAPDWYSGARTNLQNRINFNRNVVANSGTVNGNSWARMNPYVPYTGVEQNPTTFSTMITKRPSFLGW